MTASKVLTDKDRYLELATSCHAFMVEAKEVDELFKVGPIDPKNTEWGVGNLKCLPINYTDLTATIKVFENAKFKKSTPWGRKNRGVDEDGLEDPEVYFVFAFSCDVDLDNLIERVLHEWRHQ